MTTVYTLSHSTRCLEELGSLPDARAVRLPVDVRRHPGSRRPPHFDREPTETWPADAGHGG